MRHIALTLRQAILLLLISWGLFTVLIAVGERVSGQWRAPGLIALLVLVGIEATITQRLVARERMRFEEQAGVRLLELVIVVLLVRVWSLLADDKPILEAMQPWLRSPLQVFSGRFGEYFLWAMLAWLFTTFLTVDVIGWDSAETAVELSEQSIERAQMEQEWSLAVSRFDLRYTVIAVVTLMASGFVLSNAGAEGTPPLSASRLQITLADIAVIVPGLLLHGSGRLNQLRRSWNADRIAADSQIDRRWNRTGLLVMAGLLLVSPLLGLVVLVIPAPPLVPVANAILVVMTFLVTIVILLIGLMLAPIIWLLSLLVGEGAPGQITPPVITPPQIAEAPRERPLLPALIFWGCVVVLLLIAVVRYVNSRSDLREALSRWRLLRWLVVHGRELWTDTRSWLELASERVGQLLRGRQRRLRKVEARGAQAQLRALYRRMREAGARRGVVSRPAQTPNEYSSALAQDVPAVEQDVRGLTDVYVKAEYGPAPAHAAEVRRARDHWRRLQRWLVKPARVRKK